MTRSTPRSLYRHLAIVAIALGATGMPPSIHAKTIRPRSTDRDFASTRKASDAVRDLLPGYRVIRKFSAISQLTGWVLKDPDGRYDLVYTTSNGQALFSGALLTASGEDLTKHYRALYFPKRNLRSLWNAFHSKANVVVSGAKKPRSVIYVIMDPNCVYCHMLWLALRPYEAAGLQVRWIPVGFLHKDSPAKAAALLQGGEAVLTQMQTKFNVRLESGGAPGIPITAPLKKELAENMALMQEAGIVGTPGILYMDKKRTVHLSAGLPTLSELPRITSLPVQEETNPALAPLSTKNDDRAK